MTTRELVRDELRFKDLLENGTELFFAEVLGFGSARRSRTESLSGRIHLVDN
jgi:hypothetical protein